MKGKCLTRSPEEPSYIVAVLDWVYARIIAALLLPLHMLARKIVYSKIHAAIGISKVVYGNGYQVEIHFAFLLMF